MSLAAPLPSQPQVEQVLCRRGLYRATEKGPCLQVTNMQPSAGDLRS